MKGFIEIYTVETETYYVNISQIKYYYIPKLGDKNVIIVLGDGKEIKCGSFTTIESFQDSLSKVLQD